MQTQSTPRRPATCGLRSLATLIASAAITLGSGGVVGVQQVAAAAPPPKVTQVDFAQCANGTADATNCADPSGWINGILNHNNSSFFEDQVTAQRLEVNVPAGAAQNTTDTVCAGDPACHTVTIHYQTRKGSSANHAYDSLATWNYTLSSADRCQGLAPSDCVGGSPSTFAIPPDPTQVAPPAPLTAANATSLHQLTGQVMTAFGATLKGVSVPVHDCTAANNCQTASTDDYATVVIAFDVPSTTVAHEVQLLFGGHLAASFGPRGWGAGIGSAFISGGPYHFKWIAVDGASIGNRDNQIQGSSIFVNPSITTSATASASIGSSISHSATLTGAVPAATGTITFTAYGPVAGTNPTPTCTTVAFTSSTFAVSGPGTYGPASFTPTQAGTYFWIASYSGDGSDAPATTACGDNGETSLVAPKSPTIATTANPTTGSPSSGPLQDSATLSGTSNLTGLGTITFYLFAPGVTCATDGTGYTYHEVVTGINGNGPWSTVTGYGPPLVAGTYQWVAVFSGDANNNAAHSACGPSRS